MRKINVKPVLSVTNEPISAGPNPIVVLQNTKNVARPYERRFGGMLLVIIDVPAEDNVPKPSAVHTAHIITVMLEGANTIKNSPIV